MILPISPSLHVSSLPSASDFSIGRPALQCDPATLPRAFHKTCLFQKSVSSDFQSVGQLSASLGLGLSALSQSVRPSWDHILACGASFATASLECKKVWDLGLGLSVSGFFDVTSLVPWDQVSHAEQMSTNTQNFEARLLQTLKFGFDCW